MKKLISLFFILILLNSCEKHQYDTVPLSTSFQNSILKGYFVTAIAFDNLGNAWIGTFKQGLIKYNGRETIVYNSSNSIISSTSVINDIAIDSKNNVWIGSEGLIKYDGANFTLYNSKNTAIPEDFVYSIAIDSKDNVWFTSSRFRQGGVVKYDGTNWTVYKPDNSLLPVNSVKSVAIDKNDNVWLALSEIVNNSYLVKIANNRWTIYTSSDLGFSPYYFGNIQFDNNNRLYGSINYSFSSTYSTQRPPAFSFDGNTTQQYNLYNLSGFKFLTVDNQDHIWGAMYGGFAVYNGKDWITDDKTFKEVSVFAIEQANDGHIWVGTGDGVYINN